MRQVNAVHFDTVHYVQCYRFLLIIKPAIRLHKVHIKLYSLRSYTFWRSEQHVKDVEFEA